MKFFEYLILGIRRRCDRFEGFIVRVRIKNVIEEEGRVVVVMKFIYKFFYLNFGEFLDWFFMLIMMMFVVVFYFLYFLRYVNN